MKYLNQRYFPYIFIFFAFLGLNSFSQNANPTAPFKLFGKVFLDDKPAENVSLELMKDGQSLKKIMTTKNGKYSFTMDQDTENPKNEYTLHVVKEGTVPKTIIINTYIPKEEYDDESYEYVLEISLLPTKINDVVLQRPSGKIKWNASDKNFGIDLIYAKVIQKEEDKLKRDPDKYLKDLAAKMKKEEDAKKKKAADEEAKKKADEEARKAAELARKNLEEEEALARLREKEKAELELKEKLAAMKTQMKQLAKVNDSTKVEIPVAPALAVENNTQIYDQAVQYELKKAGVELQKRKQLQEKKKTANLATKYETSNAMSSLLDAIDEHDKRMKNK